MYNPNARGNNWDIEVLKSRYDDQQFITTLNDSAEQTLRLARNPELSEDKNIGSNVRKLKEDYAQIQAYLPPRKEDVPIVREK